MKGRLNCGITGWQIVCNICGHKGFFNNENYMSHSEAELWSIGNGWKRKDLFWICPNCVMKEGQNDTD